MVDDTAFLTLPLNAGGELLPQYNVISEVFRKLPTQLAEALGTTLGTEVEVSDPAMATFSREELLAAIDPTVVCLIHATFSEGIEGGSFFAAKNDVAIAFAGVILGEAVEDGSEGLSTDSMDAFREMVNQISGKVDQESNGKE